LFLPANCLSRAPKPPSPAQIFRDYQAFHNTQYQKIKKQAAGQLKEGGGTPEPVCLHTKAVVFRGLAGLGDSASALCQVLVRAMADSRLLFIDWRIVLGQNKPPPAGGSDEAVAAFWAARTLNWSDLLASPGMQWDWLKAKEDGVVCEDHPLLQGGDAADGASHASFFFFGTTPARVKKWSTKTVGACAGRGWFTRLAYGLSSAGQSVSPSSRRQLRRLTTCRRPASFLPPSFQALPGSGAMTTRCPSTMARRSRSTTRSSKCSRPAAASACIFCRTCSSRPPRWR
jgi:hypothetical protein